MKFVVKNMSCMHCVNRISNQLKSLKIKKFEIDLDSKTVFIKKTKVSQQEIKVGIEEIGYDFELIEE